MTDKLMYILNDYTHFYPRLVKTFEQSINEQINQNSLKLLCQQIRKRYYITLGTSVTNSPLSPLYLFLCEFALIVLKCLNTYYSQQLSTNIFQTFLFITTLFRGQENIKKYSFVVPDGSKAKIDDRNSLHKITLVPKVL